MHARYLLGCLAVAVAAPAATAAPASAHKAGSSESIANMKDKIKNVVLLVMENRSVDNVLGGQTIKGLENPINNGPFCNPVNANDPSEGEACSEASSYDSILNDPDHSITGNNIQFYGDFTPDNKAIADGTLTPTQKGFLQEQLRSYPKDNETHLAKQVMNYYTEEQVPVLTSMTQNFVVFNHWHSDIPGPTNPNRVSLLSGTSAGHGKNDASMSTIIHGIKHRSIFQQLSESDRTWANYYTWAVLADSQFFDWTWSSFNALKAKPFSSFYKAAEKGELPDFTYLNPSCCGKGTNSMHPTGLISDGETLLKDVYDALRASPQWNQTLFIVTFDETGGFHDHVPPPLAVRPDDETYTEEAADGSEYTFEFNRLGGRVPTFLISPWVGEGFVEQKGQTSAGDTASYSASSILRTLGYLWDFEPFTPRVEHAPSFDHLIRGSMRDTPSAMPNVVPFGGH
ncbi:phosphoesterase [Aspergillus taichungensis]|uniref:Phosphoesterase n=1 Tax=Aspergillus taichungensis TaxID=482145 RepID=A0A2J5HWJ9_9EURO|nr:phosphoesterase [Aspergillus taichungensis]